MSLEKEIHPSSEAHKNEYEYIHWQIATSGLPFTSYLPPNTSHTHIIHSKHLTSPQHTSLSFSVLVCSSFSLWPHKLWFLLHLSPLPFSLLDRSWEEDHHHFSILLENLLTLWSRLLLHPLSRSFIFLFHSLTHFLCNLYLHIINSSNSPFQLILFSKEPTDNSGLLPNRALLTSTEGTLLITSPFLSVDTVT